jgi:DNA-binding NarL/FixJ family response regulator
MASSLSLPGTSRSRTAEERTAATHPRDIFRKVDVSSRVELARTVERADSDSL